MIDHLSKEQPLKNRLQQILNNENLEAQHALISAIATELGVTPLTCAAALLYLTQSIENPSPRAPQAQQKTAPQ